MDWSRPNNGLTQQHFSIVCPSATQPTMRHSLTGSRYNSGEPVSSVLPSLKKKAPGALDRLDSDQVKHVAAAGRGSKVVAKGGYPQNPQTGPVLQLPEIPWKVLEPATGIEPATCGLRKRSDTLTPAYGIIQHATVATHPALC